MNTMKFNDYSKQMFDVAASVEKSIVALFAEKGIKTLHTEKEDCDPIYAYRINDDSTCEEIQVKGILVDNNDVYVCLDQDSITYTDGDIAALEENTDNEWISVFGSEIYSVFTMFNIAEYLDEYIK